MAEPVWRIAREAGRNVDANLRPLAAPNAEGVGVEFSSAYSDLLTWSVFLSTIAEFKAILPDLGQRKNRYRDAVRSFTGTVTRRPIRFSGATYRADVVVEGPWWWLSQMALSSEIEDQPETASERTAFVLSTGSPRTNINALINRAITLRAPISEGSLASGFAVPRCSLHNIPFTDAFSEMMRCGRADLFRLLGGRGACPIDAAARSGRDGHPLPQ